MRRPRPVAVGRVHARPIRGPDQHGRWYWRAELRVDGARRTVWTGWASPEGVTRELAELVVEGREAERRTPAADEVVTVRDLLEVWLGAREESVELGQLAPGTAASSRVASRRLVDALGSVRLARIDRQAIERYVAQSLRSGRAPGTIGLDLTYLRAAWQWARERELVPDRSLPLVRVARPRAARARPTPEQVARLVGWLELHAPPWVSVLVRFLAETGTRIGEAGALLWGDVDLVGRQARVAGKTGPRTIALSTTAVSDLASWRAEAAARDPARVAPDRGVWGVARVGAATGCRRALDSACEALELPRLTPHALRRLAVDRLYRSGADVSVAAALLGHSPATALAAYREASEADLAAAVDSLSPVVAPRQSRVVSITGRRTPKAHNTSKG